MPTHLANLAWSAASVSSVLSSRDAVQPAGRSARVISSAASAFLPSADAAAAVLPELAGAEPVVGAPAEVAVLPGVVPGAGAEPDGPAWCPSVVLEQAASKAVVPNVAVRSMARRRLRERCTLRP